MCNRPKVSVIVLIYNVEHFIEKCVESLFNQTLDDIEFIFIDDCSTDASLTKLNGLLTNNPHRASQSVVISNPSNFGQAKSRIIGINNAHGKYIIACDSDDFVDCCAYDELYNFIENTKSDIVSCNFVRVNNNKSNIENYSGIDTPDCWIKNILLTKKMGALWCHMIRAELFSNILYPTSNIMEDVVILTQCILKSEKVLTYNKPLYHYNYREGSISNNPHKIIEQAHQMSDNMGVISSILISNSLSYKQYIECKYFFIKRWLLPIVKTFKDCSRWIKFDPWVNRKILFNPFINFKAKISTILIFLRLYPIIKRIIK